MKKRWMMMVIFIGIFLLASCSSDGKGAESGSNGDKSKDGKNVIKVGYMPNFAGLNTVIAGIETGSFEEEGIDVDLVEFDDGPTIISAMNSGSIDVGYIGPGAHVLPIKGEADIFAFSHLGNADEVIGSADSGVNAIEDLKGKTIAMASGTSSETILNLALNEAGLTKDDVKLMDMDASAIVTAMASGKIDAAATWSPNTNAIKKELGDDAVALADNERYAEKFPSIASWVTKPGYADENPGLLEKFTKGIYKGMDYREDHMEEVAGWVAKQTAVDVDSVLEETDDAEWLTSDELIDLIDDGTIESYYQTQQENFVDEGELTEDELQPVEDYVLFDLMLDAGK